VPSDTAAQPYDAARVARLIGQLSNSDIEWDGSIVGLLPRVIGDAARQLAQAGELAIPALVEAVDDDSMFVAIHVLLTLLSGVEYPTIPWNGLEVELVPAQAPRIDPAQRGVLSSRWRAWLASTPRPRALPAAPEH
jgi:hypothetical protein